MSANSQPTKTTTSTLNLSDDPRTSAKYVYIRVDSTGNKIYSPRGNNLLKLDAYLDTLYLNYSLFYKEKSSTYNLNIYATLILTTINNIIEIIKPCASDTEIDAKCSCVYDSSCTDSDKCIYINEIQLLLLDYILNLTSITNQEPKTDYDYVPFFIQKNTADVITGNEANKNMVSPDEYLLCSTTRWVPKSTDPVMAAKYKKVLAIETQKQANVINNILMWNIIYAVSSVIVLAILYIWYKNRQTN
jgi:hypothetical protein